MALCERGVGSLKLCKVVSAGQGLDDSLKNVALAIGARTGEDGYGLCL